MSSQNNGWDQSRYGESQTAQLPEDIRKNEGNILFNNVLNTFYFSCMVSDMVRNPLLLFHGNSLYALSDTQYL